MSTGDILVLEHVCKSFGARPVVQDVSFSVKEGEIFGFLGPNGAGKTTTIKMILGLLSIMISKENANNYDDYYHKYNKNKFLLFHII